MKVLMLKKRNKDIREIKDLCQENNYKVIEEISAKDPANPSKEKIEKINQILEEKPQLKKIVLDQEIKRPRKEDLEKATEKEIMDRFDLILEIFEEHMSSSLGKKQLEYIKTKRKLSKLRRMDKGAHERHRSRTATKKISRLKEDISKKKKKYKKEINKLMDQGYPSFSLTGYTNAGKSTLFNNLLEKKQVKEKSELFTTLKTTARTTKIKNTKIMLVDTVGFFKEIPHDLIPAFKTTLYAAKECDFVLSLVDIQNSKKIIKERINLCMNQVTEKFKGKPMILLNKIDKTNKNKDEINQIKKEIKEEYKVPVYKISAKEKIDIKKPIKEAMKNTKIQEKNIKVPYKELKNKSETLNKLKNSPLTTDIEKRDKYLKIKIKGTNKAIEKNNYLIKRLNKKK